MNKFDPYIWKRVAGDALLVAPYILAPLCLSEFLKNAKSDSEDDKIYSVIALCGSLAFHIVSHLISAGMIK